MDDETTEDLLKLEGLERGRGRRPTKTNSAMIIQNISLHVRQHFKAYCYKRGSTVSHEIRKFMLQCIANDNKLDIKPVGKPVPKEVPE